MNSRKSCPKEFVPNTCFTSRPVPSVLGSSPSWFSKEWGVHHEPCQLHHEEEEELCAHCWFLREFVDVCKTPSSFCFNCCKVDNACLKSGLCSNWHSIGTCLVWSKPPITLVMIKFLRGQMVGMIFICKSIPLSTNIFVSTIFNHSITECFISYDACHEFLGRTFSCTSSTGWPKSIPCLRTFCHIDVREVVLSSRRTPELKEGPSYTWWIADSPLFLYARSARTCNRRCQCSSMMNILCTAFWVPSRVIHIIRCSQHPESLVLTLDWKIKILILS